MLLPPILEEPPLAIEPALFSEPAKYVMKVIKMKTKIIIIKNKIIIISTATSSKIQKGRNNSSRAFSIEAHMKTEVCYAFK